MSHRPAITRTAVVAVVLALLSSLPAIGAGTASAATRSGAAQTATRPFPAAKRSHWVRQPGESRTTVDVKFAEGTDVRVRGGRLVSASTGPITDLDATLDRFPGTRVQRLFDGVSEEQHGRRREEAEARSGRPEADLNLFFRLETGPGTDVTQLVDALNALDIVTTAAPAPEPTAPPVVTPSFVTRQAYRTGSATGGIDADYAQTLTGGKGEYVAITDVEYGWNRSHEDLSKLRVAGSALANGTPCDPFATSTRSAIRDHGTAVIGELAGDANAFGVTGLAPNAALRTVNAARTDASGYCGTGTRTENPGVSSIAAAINVAANSSSAGDVILIEQQMSGPNRTNAASDVGLVPVEWDQSGAIWSAIRNATDRGIIVVEAAGNGSQNLDDPIYHGWFSYDSGAILVGAGNATGCAWGAVTAARARLPFSNSGTRVDVQGWGDCVTTTGVGDLQGGVNPSVDVSDWSGRNQWYSGTFAGTSSASPIVAASAALLSSISEARGSTALTPATVRTLLRSTGKAQAGTDTARIGPLPDLRAAVAALGPKVADAGHGIGGATVAGTKVPVVQRWSNPSGGAAQYDVWLQTDGAATYVQQTLANPAASSAAFQLESGHTYRFAARAKDATGVWGDWAFGSAFDLGLYQESYTATNPAYTGTWPRSTYDPASGGALSVSATAGDTATFTFTGTEVGWVATRSTNRGQADVYVDGTLAKRVDLYSATTAAQTLAFTKAWTTSGPHTIKIRVVGTAGHPKVDVDAFVRLR